MLGGGVPRRRLPLALALVAGGVAACANLLGVGNLRDRVSDAGMDGGMDAEADAGPDVCTPEVGVCSPFPQCGCLTNQNCEITTVYGNTTCTTIGTTPLWHGCTTYGQCELGATCVGGVCKPFCSTAADCAGTNVTCEQIIDYGSGKPVPGLKVCSAGCDPVDPSAICGPGVTCFPYPWNGLGKDHGDCVGPTGSGVGPDACSGTNLNEPCAPGYYCTTTHDCVHWCRVGHATDCLSGELCEPFISPQPVIAGVEYGVCVETD
jgi:hypothetical protein